jgi:hypothetical protein
MDYLFMKPANPPNSAHDPLRTIGRVSTFATFGLFVIVVAKYVDSRSRIETEMASQEQLVVLGSEQQEQLLRFRSDAPRMQREWDAIEARSIQESELPAVQDRILALAREHGCQSKKASPRNSQARPFEAGAAERGSANAPEGIKSPFEIHEVGLALSIEGDLEHTLEFLRALQRQTWYATASQIVLRRDPAKPGNMALELELKFASLHRKRSQLPFSEDRPAS